MQIPVSELVVRYLERLGIDTLFGVPGAHILPVYDALHDSTVQAVLAKHEQGAAFMAGGYARASGRIGACITTAGPGATNLVTGIANAYADRLPILIITGETPTHIFGKGGLQESSGEGGSIDQLSLFKGITRYNRIVERTDYLPQVLNRAAKILRSPNPGPVLLSFPFNVQRELADASALDAIQFEPHRPSVHEAAAVRPLAERLAEARSPVIVAGYGCIRAGAQAEVAALSERLKIPVTTSLKAKGVIDERSPLSLGSLGVTSSGHAYRYLLEKADLLLILGASFNERTSYVWDRQLLAGKRVVQVDHDFEQLEKVFEAEVAIEGDIKAVLGGLLALLDARNGDRLQQLSEEIDRSKSAVGSDYTLFQSGFSLVERFFRELERHFPEGATLFDDNIIFAQNFLNVSSGNRYHPNSGISSLGHAIPAAIGARFVEARPTFAILGDGGFQMCAMELMTAVNYRIPLNVVLFNNGSMGLIRKNQHQHYQRRFINCDFVNPDFALLAQSFGIAHRRVERAEQVDELFTGLDLHEGINLIEIVIDKDIFPNYSSRR
ncbi:thiamine pyrophosphate-binding protein [Endothiovibrio diazotrophicus]